jgi:hypothetical protein
MPAFARFLSTNCCMGRAGSEVTNLSPFNEAHVAVGREDARPGFALITMRGKVNNGIRRMPGTCLKKKPSPMSSAPDSTFSKVVAVPPSWDRDRTAVSNSVPDAVRATCRVVRSKSLTPRNRYLQGLDGIGEYIAKVAFLIRARSVVQVHPGPP